MKSEYIIAALVSILIGYLTYLVMLPFLDPIFRAIVLVIVFYPYYRWILNHVTRRKPLASLIACFTIALFILVPLALFGSLLANELIILYQWADNYLRSLSTRAHNTPIFIFSYLEKVMGRYFDVSSVDIRNILANNIKDIGAFASESVKGFIKNLAEFIFDLVLSFFAMYFLFIDGQGLLDVVKKLLPLTAANKEKLVQKTRDVISSAFYGGLLVGAVQGLLGGLSFWFLGLSAPLLWGAAMFILSFLPAIGTAFVWLPAVVYLFVIGSTAKGVILFVWSAFVVSLIDNFLRPLIVSGQTNIHPLLLFFSILGAVNVFGLIGIIAGPLIICIGQSIVEIYQDTLKNNGT